MCPLSYELAHDYLIMYGSEGEVFSAYFTDTEEAQKILPHWRKTGDLLINELNLDTMKMKKIYRHPSKVKVYRLDAVETFEERDEDEGFTDS